MSLRETMQNFATMWRDAPATQVASQYQTLADSISADTHELWAREDSAYQRMVADMQKAGLNPWTGIASGGSPTGDFNPSLDKVSGLIQVLNMYTDFASNVGLKGTGQAMDLARDGLKEIGSTLRTVLNNLL